VVWYFWFEFLSRCYYSYNGVGLLTEFFILDSQRIAYNAERKIIKTMIEKPFYKAGKLLGWDGKPPGLGFNKKLIELILRTNSTLIVFVEDHDRDYFLSPDKLKHFLLHNNHEYKTPKGVWVDVIPWSLFTHRMVHVA